MEISKFDSRTRAEAGAPMQILDPITGEAVADGDKPCRVIVRGVASKSMQAEMRAKQKAAMAKAAAIKEANKGKGGAADVNEARVMEDIHNQLCEGAAPFIVGFENMERDSKPMTADDVEWFLDLSFPEMGMKEDENGEAIMEDGIDEDGNPTKSPAFEMKNNPFAKQIGEFAAKQANFLGNVKGS